MSRTATCRQCGADFVTPSNTGRLPVRCYSCADGFASRYRQEVLELRDRVAVLEQQLADRPRLVLGADRQALAIAVRRVGGAQGRAATRDALLRLRDVAHTWADILTTEARVDGDRSAS